MLLCNLHENFTWSKNEYWFVIDKKYVVED